MSKLSDFEALQLAATLISSSKYTPQASEAELIEKLFDTSEKIKAEQEKRTPPRKMGKVDIGLI
ncbi:hypothetical protein LVJ82_00555 [Vitreoscilla massiliensis]|uniref:Uncharacterized protein n=1 Tax=Vitreoscilla massiliensis TaxID=1689272 RepID=A0ABY4E3U3_9NEIS|nr:hypothetical protein [Vitreoscilla massiliensis]UOO89505.1 hypothetical protein LVJ82_00555 [Vitreoscilla massiliensis]